MRLSNSLFISALCAALAACGGGGNSNNDDGDSNVETSSGRLLIHNPVNNNAEVSLRQASYRLDPPMPSSEAQVTVEDGTFSYSAAETITFNLLGQEFGPIAVKSTIDQHDLAKSVCTDENDTDKCHYNVAKNLQRLFLSIDEDRDPANGAIFMDEVDSMPAELNSSIDRFDEALGRVLLPMGLQTSALFKPSLGINLEAPQPEADEVGGQPLAFVDLFRVARPFTEYSCTDISYDDHGWPLDIPDSCSDQEHPVLRVASYATTLILRYVPNGAIPTGKYTVMYEGSADLQYSGIAQKVADESTQGRDIIEITEDLLSSRNAAGLRLQIKDMDTTHPIKNIRIVMPGGTCEGNPFLRVESVDECPAGEYQSFVERLEQDRNAIVFNPVYLRLLRDYQVIRTMNFMEASPRNPCFLLSDEAYTECLLQPFEWQHRALMDDASWGGSARTPLLERYGRGVPLEVVIELANQLQRTPWFNLPHNATDDYVERFATMVRDKLDPSLKAYVEYSNEPWNGIFWGALYTREKGLNEDLDDNPYWAGYKYYSNRAVEIFKIWSDVFGGSERLVRVLNTFHPDQWTSRNGLNFNGNSQYIDALASAPYFYGCWDRAHTLCRDEEKVPMLTTEATSVDDLFDIVDNEHHPYGLPAMKRYAEDQAQVAKDFDVSLITYEGGQHLTVRWEDQEISTERKNELLELFRAANRDPRMAERYQQLLSDWKEVGGELFTLYTLPQTYHRFGSFGIKEHLGQKRDDTPKYDMSMQFQEEQGNCWWKSCE